MIPGPGEATTRAVTTVVTLLVLLATAGCLGESRTESVVTPPVTASVGQSPSSTRTSTPSATPPPYLEVPAGVELTEPGTELALGDNATVAWKLPKGTSKKKGKKRRPRIAAVKIKVRTIESATFELFAGWQLSDAARRSNPFFVRATVTNVGKTDLSGLSLPIYIVDGRNTLIRPSSFDGTFKKCPSTPLPDKFTPGKRVKVCAVYLSPKNGGVTAVSVRPREKFNPITWVGKVRGYGAVRDKSKSKQDP
ncbi:MAG: hypothetical protein ACRCYU_23855 [Nocardioides sp.]